jgi:hypothetical protein
MGMAYHECQATVWALFLPGAVIARNAFHVLTTLRGILLPVSRSDTCVPLMFGRSMYVLGLKTSVLPTSIWHSQM